ncbi:MAG TPA: UDP-N-acetylmuramoyl-L-alanine--D-glutamate ligase [Tenericutes bacterium]|nr:UDP-N-acetylmuramoyl-L-alanine--D-glutamate ligase [Mycoplasmatota bacterium]
MFENKKIFILGMARSGYEAAKVLANLNNEIIITDAKDQDKDKVLELEKLGVKFIKTNEPIEIFDETFDFVVKNPGVPIDHPLILKAKELNIKVTNEVEVAYSLLPSGTKIVGITGSNGKTTTTTLTYEMMKESGLRVHLGGNIGIPMCALLNDVKPNDILVLEIAGHQLHDFINFKTDVSVMTNLFEVHIDHFKTFEYYKKTKTRIFDHHTINDIAIINKNNIDSIIETENIKSKKIFFSSTDEADIYIKEKAIDFIGEKIINLNDIRIKGVHNYENIMCAITVAKQFGVTNEAIYNVLTRFHGVEHRLEFVNRINNRDFYNDSKSTNIKSTQIALGSFDKPVILILGGLDRGHSFDELKPYMKNVKYVICYGETKFRIKDFCDTNNINCTIVDDLKIAVKVSYNLSDEGDTILLSPACASWDQYDSFEQRGEEFKNSVNSLK